MASLVDWLCFSGAHLVTGLPVASGKAYFYVPGSTSTAVDIFSDPEETTPLAQPVTLDAAGKATVYCREQAEIVIKTALGAAVTLSTNGNSKNAEQVVADWDGVDTPLDTVMSEIEASLGAGGQYLEGGTNTVARDYQDVVKQFISPYDFGAAGNGTADDTVPLTRAIARAIATGLPLNLEVGTYKITSGLTAAGIINIYGAGASKAIITTTATALTGLTVVASGSYLRDFAVHVPYAGDTYDKALVISGSTCTVERLEVTGGMGIYSTAPHTHVKDCVVTFDCPNTAGAYGYGIYVAANSIVENCSVTASHGSSSYLTAGVYLYSGSSESTSVCFGGRIAGCYVGGEGFFLRTEFDTCTTGIKCTGPLHGGAFCRGTSCTTGLSVSGGVYTINIGNHWDEVPTYDGATGYQESSSATPTFTVHSEHDVNVFKCTYAGAVSMLTVNIDSDASWKVGKRTKIAIQSGASTSAFSAYTWGTDVTPIANPSVAAPGVCVISEWMFVGLGQLIQITAWVSFTGAQYF